MKNKKKLTETHSPSDNYNTFVVSQEDAGTRLDKFLFKHLTTIQSRTAVKQIIENNMVTINEKPITKANTLIKFDDIVRVQKSVTIDPEQIKKEKAEKVKELNIDSIHQGEDFLIVNKPAGLLVHSTPIDITSVTLADWLLTKFPHVEDVGEPGRPGIVHRLDKNTSGIMILALTQDAYQTFVGMFKNRLIKKTYHAFVKGHPDKEGFINVPIGRHPVHRHKMTTFKQKSTDKIRSALTQYKVLNYFDDSTLIELQPKTGRTHQIRVHMTALGHPLLGDYIYGSQSTDIARHALHAHALEFEFKGKKFYFSCPAPDDFKKVIEKKLAIVHKAE